MSFLKNIFSIKNDLEEIIGVIKIVRDKITDDCDVNWTNYNTPKELRMDIDADLDELINGNIEKLDIFYFRFAPTSTFQEVSVSNDWGDEYISLATKFDELYSIFKNKNT